MDLVGREVEGYRCGLLCFFVRDPEEFPIQLTFVHLISLSCAIYERCPEYISIRVVLDTCKLSRLLQVVNLPPAMTKSRD